MSDLAVQASFNSGEWAPSLFARVDIQKYRSGAALLENFFVDYRGGASTRAGTEYVIQVFDSTHTVRLIPFQAAFNTGYVLEFGQDYLRFIFDGSPILETGISITAATNANPCVLTVPGNTYATNDWIFVSGVGGMTQLNGRYFIITNVAGNNITIADLFGNAINSTGYGTYTSGGTTQRIYKIASPYAASDLALLKYAQATTEMVLTHPNYPPYVLTLVSATDWTLVPITIGSTAGTPTGVASASTLPVANIFTTPVTVGQTYYSYVVSSIDANGQESTPSAPTSLGPLVDIRTYGGSNQIVWTPVTGALGYNVYEATVSYFGVQPPGVEYGFIGTTKGTTFIDSNIIPDFTQTTQINMDPFTGSGISFVTVTTSGTYTTVPSVTFSGGSPSISASGHAVLGVTSTPTVTAGGTSFKVGDTLNFGNSLVLIVTAVSSGAITAWSISNPGAISSGSTPSNPIAMVSTSGTGTGATATATWGVLQVIVDTQGAGYSSTPTVVFGAGAATATATLSPTGNGNPSVPGFVQQRLFLGGAPGAPQTFHLSQPGSYFNFNITDPSEPDNAITGTLVTNTLNTIKSVVSVTSGFIIFTDKCSFLVNGGTSGSAISPSTIVANAQSYIGANDVPPIIANYDVLYVQSKGSIVRDLAYNIYFNVFTGTDISLIASHLFYGFEVTEWAYAEQPFFMVWAVRNDGVMLTLTFLKEQDFTGWTHQVTQGAFKSVASVTETTTDAGNVDAVYTVVQRVVGVDTLQYIERVTDRIYPNGLSSAWCVDSGLQYTGSATLSFQGAEHLAGLTVTGLATDNLGNVTIITPFVMPSSGFFTLPAPTPPGATGYTTVTIGLSYIAKLQTLALELGEPNSQGKVKKIPHVDVRVNQTLGLTIGPDFDHLTPMKDLIQGNVSSMLTGQESQLVSGLYSGDARTFLPVSSYTVPGQYCIEQPNPYPASVLGVFPAYVIGDDR